MSSSGLRDQLQAIYDKHERLTPALVVEEARDESHPLHNRFEWDDAVAGEAWRKRQAGDLIRSVKIKRVTKGNASMSFPKVRAFQPIRTDDGYVYEPSEVVASDPFLTKMLLRDMEREWRTMRDRYDAFSEFWNMVYSDIPDLPDQDDVQEAAD